MCFPMPCGGYIYRHAFAFTCLVVAACCFSIISMMFQTFASFCSFAGVIITCANALSAQSSHLNYTTVTGYFLQDDPSTNASVFDFTTTNFGLLNRTYAVKDAQHGRSQTQWQRFAAQLSTLQRNASRDVQYKLLFMGRHGEGFHNAAESYYGTPAWNCYYSILNGNATTTWADAHLTSPGELQATKVNQFWAAEIEGQRIVTPQSFYTSPLTRCLATAQLSFDGLRLEYPFIPTVKELLREGISGHTCDRRSNKSYIQGNFPTYRIEQGFSEEDRLWEPLHGETSTDQDIRSKTVLDDIFEHDRNTYVSITSHSGEIASLLRGRVPWLCK